MADSANEDGYSDDDLDALESEDFLRLQEQAISANHPQPAPPRGQPITADELGLTRKTVAKGSFHAATGALIGNAGRISSPAHREAATREQLKAAQYGPGPTPTIPEQPRRSAQGSVSIALPHRTSPSQPDPTEEDLEDSDTLRDDGGGDESDLRRRLQELLREKEHWKREEADLRHSAEDAKKDVLGKSGEIAVLRSKHTRQLQDREKLYQTLQQQHKDQSETHRRELEDARKDRERLVTHNRFLDHEINDQAFQIRRSRPNGKSKEQSGLTSTPKRQRHQLFADGFEDNELEALSPSKIGAKAKPPTPKFGAKRKRDALNASPAASPSKNQLGLDFAPAGDSPLRLAPPKPVQSFSARADDSRAQFLHALMNHRVRPGEARLLEQLANAKLPSKPNTSLYEMFLDKTPPRIPITDTEDIPASVGLVILELWSRCLEERFYSPLCIFMDLINYVLFNGSMATAVRLMDETVNLSQRTADINVIPRFKKLNKNAKVISVHLHDQAIESSKHVDVSQCLRLLYATATFCASDQEAMARFWHCMRFDFISMLLRVVQPIADIVCIVRLLKTCARHDLFSAIKSQNAEGSFAEQHVMDRITSMLIEVPRPLEGESAYDVDDILKLRLEIVLLIERICEQKAASRTLAMHPQGIGRLVRVMNDELNAIYADQFHRKQRSSIISRAVMMLFHLTSTYGQEIDLKDRLQQQPGGVNKFLITLARLAFSDAIYYEREISEDAFDCAHHMLEDFVTPEEAESLKAAFVKEG